MIPSVNDFLKTAGLLQRAQLRLARLAELDELYANIVAVHRELDPEVGGLDEVLASRRDAVWHAGGVVICELERRGV